jgi:guanylate kinase
MQNRARLFVIAAPSGAGKTTLVNALVKRNPELRFSVSYTTRKPRQTELHGRDYLFVNEPEFLRLRDSGEMLESAIVFDNRYGTSRSQVEQLLSEGHHVILEIDWQGARQVRESMRRLRGRRTDSEDVINRRLRDALGDMSHWQEFDFVIVNDDLDTAIDELEAIVEGGGDANRTSHSRLREKVSGILH